MKVGPSSPGSFNITVVRLWRVYRYGRNSLERFMVLSITRIYLIIWMSLLLDLTEEHPIQEENFSID